ncbi:MAG: KH domain-containing protein [Archaeoglobaceae archaeon]
MQKTEMKIPYDRVGVIIGKEGEVKKQLEERTGCKLKVGEASISIEGEDAIGFLQAQDVIRAIGYGFNPQAAFKLLDSDYIVLDVIPLDYESNDLKRIKGRIIGKEGKMRKLIEELLGVRVSVYHKSVAIIGEVENAGVAREAVTMLIDGAQHNTVRKFLEDKRRELKLKVLDWEDVLE